MRFLADMGVSKRIVEDLRSKGQRLNQVLAGVSDIIKKGCVVTVEDSRYRLRKLPIN